MVSEHGVVNKVSKFNLAGVYLFIQQGLVHALKELTVQQRSGRMWN